MYRGCHGKINKSLILGGNKSSEQLTWYTSRCPQVRVYNYITTVIRTHLSSKCGVGFRTVPRRSATRPSAPRNRKLPQFGHAELLFLSALPDLFSLHLPPSFLGVCLFASSLLLLTWPCHCSRLVTNAAMSAPTAGAAGGPSGGTVSIY